jgi:hypothetical protein
VRSLLKHMDKFVFLVKDFGIVMKINTFLGIVYSGLFNSLQVLQRTALGPEPHEAGPVRLCVWMDDCVTCHYNFYYNYH